MKKQIQQYAICLTVGLLLTACSLPHQYEGETLQKIDEFEFSRSVQQAQEMNWPNDTWWTRYQDNQLNQLIEEALQDASTMDGAEARLKKAAAIIEQTGALRRPQIGASADASMSKVSYRYQAYSPPEGWNDYGSVALDFRYDFDFWGRNRALVAASMSRLAMAEAEKASVRLLLSTAVANSYAELARLYDNLATVKSALAVRQKTVELLTKRYDSGLENKGAVSQAESASANVEAELLHLREAIALQKNGLSALLGKGPDRGLTIEPPAIDLTTQFGLSHDAGIGLLGHRPDISAARWRAEAASSQIDAAKAQFYPDVSLSAFIGLQAFGLSDLFDSGNDAGSVGPAIYLPIFSGGRLQGNLVSAEADYDLAAADYNETLVQAIHQVADAVTSIKALDGRIAKTSQAVESARDAYRIASNRYEGGLARYLDVLTAENALLVSERMLVNLESRAFSLDLALVHALGGGYQENNNKEGREIQ